MANNPNIPQKINKIVRGVVDAGADSWGTGERPQLDETFLAALLEDLEELTGNKIQAQIMLKMLLEGDAHACSVMAGLIEDILDEEVERTAYSTLVSYSIKNRLFRMIKEKSKITDWQSVRFYLDHAEGVELIRPGGEDASVLYNYQEIPAIFVTVSLYKKLMLGTSHKFSIQSMQDLEQIFENELQWCNDPSQVLLAFVCAIEKTRGHLGEAEAEELLRLVGEGLPFSGMLAEHRDSTNLNELVDGLRQAFNGKNPTVEVIRRGYNRAYVRWQELSNPRPPKYPPEG